MKLTFVIPAHNEEKYIGKCLQSVIDQAKKSGQEVEIIVVNNASSDRTAEIASSFPEVKVIDESRKGLSQARHTGFTASTGGLIANVDADSVIPEGWIEKVFQYFSADPGLVALSGPYYYYDFSRFKNFIVRVYYHAGHIFHQLNHYFFRKEALLQGGNFILRRTALERIGGFNTEITFYGEDTDIARRIQKEGRVKFVFDLPMHTSARRLKKEGMLMTGLKYVLNHIWVLVFKKPATREHNDIR